MKVSELESDYRAESTRVLRRALLPEEPGAAELLDECLAAWPEGHGASWYPSAGRDFRDLLELESPRREENGLAIPVHLFVHTTIDRSSDNAFFQDPFTSVRTLRSARFKLHPDVKQTVGLRDAGLFSLPILPSWPAHLFEVEVTSDQLGQFRAWLLDLGISNYDFFVRFVIEQGLRFSTYIQVRQGLGLGRCTLGSVYLTPWLAWAGCREMMCDGEFPDIKPDRRCEVFRVFRAAGAPLYPPGFEVQYHESMRRWSGYDVYPATLNPTPPDGPLEHAVEVARARLKHP